MSRIRIALLSGGWSQEREVSLNSGETVYSALDREKYQVTMYDPLKDLQVLIRQKGEIDLAVILLHGRFGEDGCIQGMLEMFKIPYMGSGVLSSAMAMNKTTAKEAFIRAGLKVAEDVVLLKGAHYSVQEIMEKLGSETMVKPMCEGSSLGMSLCSNKGELAAGIERAFEYDHEVMVEEYIDGREVTCCILGNRELKALPIIEIAPGESFRFFEYEAKYTSGATREICPAPISSALGEKVCLYAKEAHRALMCRAWSRTDMIIRNESIYVLETNTVPGMTANSLFPLAAGTAGLSLSDLLDELIHLSLESTDSGQLLTR